MLNRRRGSRASCLAVLLSWALALGGSTAAFGGDAKPALNIPDPVFDWGKAYKGEQLDHDFVIENKGDAPLVIESLKPNCGCMSVTNESTYKKTLLPGEKTTIQLHVDTQVLEPGIIKGKKWTEVITNSLEGENRLWVEGEVVELFALEPTHPKVDVVRAHTAPPREPTTFTLTPNPGKTMKLVSLKPMKGILRSQFEALDGGKAYRVSVWPELKDKSAFQSENLEASVEVDGKAVPFRLPVAISLKDRIDVNPSKSLFFHKTETATMSKPDAPKVSKVLTLESIGGPAHKFAMKGVACKGGLFGVAVETLEDGKRYRLTVTLLKTPQKGERFLKDSIEVTTDDPEVPLLSIPGSAQF